MTRASGTEVQNGQALLAAYEQAKALRPQGNALSDANRAVLLVAPGRYDLETNALNLDTDFVDVIGLFRTIANLVVNHRRLPAARGAAAIG